MSDMSLLGSMFFRPSGLQQLGSGDVRMLLAIVTLHRRLLRPARVLLITPQLHGLGHRFAHFWTAVQKDEPSRSEGGWTGRARPTMLTLTPTGSTGAKPCLSQPAPLLPPPTTPGQTTAAATPAPACSRTSTTPTAPPPSAPSPATTTCPAPPCATGCTASKPSTPRPRRLPSSSRPPGSPSCTACRWPPTWSSPSKAPAACA